MVRWYVALNLPRVIWIFTYDCHRRENLPVRFFFFTSYLTRFLPSPIPSRSPLVRRRFARLGARLVAGKVLRVQIMRARGAWVAAFLDVLLAAAAPRRGHLHACWLLILEGITCTSCFRPRAYGWAPSASEESSRYCWLPRSPCYRPRGSAVSTCSRTSPPEGPVVHRPHRHRPGLFDGVGFSERAC